MNSDGQPLATANEKERRRYRPALSRRRVLSLLASLAAQMRLAGQSRKDTWRANDHFFLYLGDALISHFGDMCAARFADLLSIAARRGLKPDFLLSGGDEIDGNTQDLNTLRSEWKMFLDVVQTHFGTQTPFYPCPSNHNYQGPIHDRAWRDVFPSLPRNGAKGQEGLSYWIRRRDLLLVITHQAFPNEQNNAHVDFEWVDRALKQNRDAKYKFVVGHYPALPVNGLREAPLARLVSPDAEHFWEVLVANGVQAYLCAHIQSFDARVKDGVLQVCSAAACNGSRPPDSEYQHLAMFNLLESRLQVETLNREGAIQEWFRWPYDATFDWKAFHPTELSSALEILRQPATIYDPAERKIFALRLAGNWNGEVAYDGATVVCGHIQWQPADTIWVGLEGQPARLVVKLEPRHYFWQQTWRGPIVTAGKPFRFEIVMDSGIGPGGILWRDAAAQGPWNSFESLCSSGIETLRWPNQWFKGRGFIAEDDRVFHGEITAEYAVSRIPYAPLTQAG